MEATGAFGSLQDMNWMVVWNKDLATISLNGHFSQQLIIFCIHFAETEAALGKRYLTG